LTRSPSSPQETVDRLLRLHFRDGKTRVNGDAQLLMAEMLKVFVRGERAALGPVPARGDTTPRERGAPLVPPVPLHRSPPAEAAARAARQAQAEDLEKVDVEHVEKVLPQLVGTR
ncbi:CENPX protein, partial [Nycticryphes semicollaris]|nr:CENPX protein [Nycticryphes semicollaris]